MRHKSQTFERVKLEKNFTDKFQYGTIMKKDIKKFCITIAFTSQARHDEVKFKKNFTGKFQSGTIMKKDIKKCCITIAFTSEARHDDTPRNRRDNV